MITNLEPQRPAEGILKIADYGTSKFYKVECSCGSNDDEISFEVEIDDLMNVYVNTWTIQKTSWWDNPFDENRALDNIDKPWWKVEYTVRTWLNSFAHRCKITWQVWTQGYVKYSSNTIMSRQQALNYAEVLRQAIEECEKIARVKHESN